MAEDVFNTSGTWTCPDDIDEIEVYGHGAGSNGGNDIPAGGNGSGGGAWVKTYTIAVVPTTEYTVTVGDPDVGVDSSFDDATAFLAKGGSASAGGLASECIGDVKYSGGNPGNVVGTGEPPILDTGGSGGGSSAGPNGAGNNGSNSNGTSGGAGGAAVEGGGAGGAGGNVTQNGANATSPGGGGGGSGAGGNGGAGGMGQVVIRYGEGRATQLMFDEMNTDQDTIGEMIPTSIGF